MRKRLQGFGEVRIVDEMNGFELDLFKKKENEYRSTTPDLRAVLQRRLDLGLVYS